MKKIIALLCAFIMLLTCLTSCFDSKTEEQTSDTTAAGGETAASDIVNYTVVYSADCSESVKTRVDELISKIQSLYGVKLSRASDKNKDAVEKEILVGHTNRPESEEFLAGLRVKDYGYAMLGGKIVISGVTDEYTVLALKNFIEIALNEKKENIAFSESDIVRGEYDIIDMKLNSVSVKGWSVVYPYDYSNSEKSFAEQLQKNLSEASGYYIRLCTDKDNVTEKAIVIKTAATSGITVSGNVITLSGEGKEELQQLSATFIGAVNGAKVENGIISVNITNDMAIKEFLTVMSFNLRFDLTENAGVSRVDAIVAQVRDLAPDVFGVQEDTVEWQDLLDPKLTEYTAVHATKPVGNDVSSQEYLTIYYRTDKFTLVDSGTKWLGNVPSMPSKFPESSIYRAMNYAVLERISDGERICFVNTHLEHNDGSTTNTTRAIARQKQTAVLIEQTQKICAKYDGVASVTVGDFNCTTNESIHLTMRENGYEDCRMSATDIKSQGTWNGAYYGGGVDKNSDILDYCYVSQNDFSICSYAVSTDKYNGMYTSDHFPVVVKLLFNE